MHIKRSLVAALVLVFAAAAGSVAFSWQQAKAQQTAFDSPGYILTTDQGGEGKQILFAADTAWKRSLGKGVTFADVQGNRIQVNADSFVHYNESAMGALTNGVLVDVQDLDAAQLVNHYAVSPEISVVSEGGSYRLANTASELAMSGSEVLREGKEWAL